MRDKRRKINNEFIDNYLKENKLNFKRCGDFVNSHVKIEWECLIDGYKWITSPTSILNKHTKTGCPKCKGGIKHSDDKVKKLLKEFNVELLDDYVNYTKKLNCKCLVCNFLFTNSLTNMQRFTRNKKYKQTPCPNCNRKINYNNETIDNLLLENRRNIIRLSDIQGAKNKTKWKCLICDTEWETAPQNLFRGIKTGCPTCKNKKENELKRYLVDTVKCDYFKHQYKLYIDNRKRLVDFCIIKNDNVYFIERNGEQHYEPICFNGISRIVAEQNFEKQLIKDKQLKDFCEEYDIKLIVIKYDMTYEEIENIINKL